MKKLCAMLRRPLAFVLAVMMVLSTFEGAIVVASATKLDVQAGQVLASHFGLGDAAAEILTSSYVAESLRYSYSYTVPDDEDSIVTVDESTGKVTAKVISDGDNLWVPIEAVAKNVTNGVEEKQLFGVVTPDADFYSVTFGTVDEKKVIEETTSYSVDVTYELWVNSKNGKNQLDGLLELHNGLAEDFDKLSSLKRTKDLLNVLLAELNYEKIQIQDISAIELLYQMATDGYAITMPYTDPETQIVEDAVLKIKLKPAEDEEEFDACDAAVELYGELEEDRDVDGEPDETFEFVHLLNSYDNNELNLIKNGWAELLETEEYPNPSYTYGDMYLILEQIQEPDFVNSTVESALEDYLIAKAEETLGSTITAEQEAKIRDEANASQVDINSEVYILFSEAVTKLQNACDSLEPVVNNTNESDWYILRYASRFADQIPAYSSNTKNEYVHLNDHLLKLNEKNATMDTWLHSGVTTALRRTADVVEVTVKAEAKYYAQEDGALVQLDTQALVSENLRSFLFGIDEDLDEYAEDVLRQDVLENFEDASNAPYNTGKDETDKVYQVTCEVVKSEDGKTADVTFSIVPSNCTVNIAGDVLSMEYGEVGELAGPERDDVDYIYMSEAFDEDVRLKNGQTHAYRAYNGLVITRVEQDAATEKSLVEILLMADLDEKVKGVLGSKTLDNPPTVFICYPAAKLINVDDGGKVTADSYSCEMEHQTKWTPSYMVVTDQEGNQSEEKYFVEENGVYVQQIEGEYKTISVYYTIDVGAELAGNDEALNLLNLAWGLRADYEKMLTEVRDQINDSEGYIKQFSKSVLDVIDRTLPTAGDERDAYNILINTDPEKGFVNMEGDKILMGYHFDQLGDKMKSNEAEAMKYFYENRQSLLESMKTIAEQMPVILRNDDVRNLIITIKGEGTLNSLENYINKTIWNSMEKLSYSNPYVDESHEDFTALLDKVLEWTDGVVSEENDEISELGAVPGSIELSTDVLVTNPYYTTITIELPVQNGETVELVKSGEITVRSKDENKVDLPVTEAVINEIKAEVEALAADLVYYKLPAGYSINASENEPISGITTISVALDYADTEVSVQGETQQVNYGERLINLPGTGDKNTYYEYSVVFNGKVIEKFTVQADAKTYKLSKQTVEALFAGATVEVETFEYDAEEILIQMADMAGDSAYVLKTGEQNYSIVLPVDLDVEGFKSLQSFVQALMAYYDTSVLHCTGKDSVLIGETLVHIQGILDAFLYSGLTSDDLVGILDAYKKDPVENDLANKLGVDSSNLIGKTTRSVSDLELGTQLIKVPMTMTKGFDTDVTFYITLKGSVPMVEELVSGYEKLHKTVTFELSGGAVNGKVTIPEDFPIYDAYMALLILDGATGYDENGEKYVASFDNLDQMSQAIALSYLYNEVLKDIVDGNTSIKTYNNTINKVETLVGEDLIEWEIPEKTTVKGITLDFADWHEQLAAMIQKDVAFSSFNGNKIGRKLSGKVDSVVDMLDLGDLANLIYEKNMGVPVEIGLTAELKNGERDYDAFVVDSGVELTSSEVLGLVGLTQDVAAKTASMKGPGMVILVKDSVDEDLTFSQTTILDLNGNTVNGDIVAQDKLTIIDSSLDNSGTVNGTVSGDVTILGGTYSANVEGFLPAGYVQENNKVRNAVFSVEENGEDVTVTIHLNRASMSKFTNAEAVATLAAEIMVDLVMNHGMIAGYYVNLPSDGEGVVANRVFDIDLEHILTQAEDAKAGGKLGAFNLLVNTLIGVNEEGVSDGTEEYPGWIDETALANIFNNLVDQLLSFQKMETALEEGTPFFEMSVTKYGWDISFEHIYSEANGDDYLDVSIGSRKRLETESNTTGETKNVKFVLDTESAYAKKALNFLAENVTVEEKVELQLDQIQYDNNKNFEISGGIQGQIYADLNGKNDDVEKYINTLAVILANNAPESERQVWIDAINSPTYKTLQELINSTTVGELLDAIVNVGSLDSAAVAHVVDAMFVAGRSAEDIAVALDALARACVNVDKSEFLALFTELKATAVEDKVAIKRIINSLKQLKGMDVNTISTIIDDVIGIGETSKDAALQIFETVKASFTVDKAALKTLVDEVKETGRDAVAVVKALYVAFKTSDLDINEMADNLLGKDRDAVVDDRFSLIIEGMAYSLKALLKVGGNAEEIELALDALVRACVNMDRAAFDDLFEDLKATAADDVEAIKRIINTLKQLKGMDLDAINTIIDDVTSLGKGGKDAAMHVFKIVKTAFTGNRSALSSFVEIDLPFMDATLRKFDSDLDGIYVFSKNALGEWDAFAKGFGLNASFNVDNVKLTVELFPEIKDCEHPEADTELVIHTPEVKPGCETEGNEEYWYCTNVDCQVYLQKDENGDWVVIEKDSWIVDATGHSYTDTKVEPTCTTGGYTVHTCSKCSASYTDGHVDALGHSYDAGVVTTAPTCSAEGVRTYTCQNDTSHTYTEAVAIDSDAHSWDAGVVTTAPTCSAEGVKTYTCQHDASHTKTETVAIDGDAHSWDAGVVTTAPSCSAEGVKTYTCQHDASHTKTETVAIDSNAHNFGAWVETKAPGFGVDGERQRECSDCHKVETDVIPALTHDHTQHVYVETSRVEPGCTKPGSVTYTCECGDSYTDSIPGTGHNYVPVVVAPTCEEQGYTHYTCDRCGSNYKYNFVDALGHSFTNYVSNNDATCTKDGTKTAKCDRCDATDTVTDVGSKGHKYVPVVTEPTCTEQGYTTYSCSKCASYYVVDYRSPLGHSFTNYVSNNNAGCVADGTKTAKCDRCDVTETIVDEGTALGHNYVATVVDPTCTEQGYTSYTCDRCGSHYNADYVPARHTLTYVEAKEPTCTEAGNVAYYVCICGKSFKDAEGKETIAVVKVEALGHDVETIVVDVTCTTPGYKKDVCKRCGETLKYYDGVAPHHTRVREDKIEAPSCTTQGYTVYTCLDCGESWTGNYVEPVGHQMPYEWTTEVEVTCQNDGLRSKSCQVKSCNYTITEVVQATGHDHWYYNTVAPTCSNPGYDVYTCLNGCGDSYKINYTGATGEHNFDRNNDGNVTEAGDATVILPTCTAQGTITYSCVNCDHVRVYYVDASGHQYEDTTVPGTCAEPGYTVHTCKVCGDSFTDGYETVEHAYAKKVTEPTCDAMGYTTYTCKNCGHSYVKDYVNAKGHKYVAGTPVAPTHTSLGYTEYTCSECNHSYRDNYTALENSKHDFELKLNTVAPTCTEAGYTRWMCKCGEIVEQNHVEPTGHKYVKDEKLSKAATCMSEGYDVYVCANCGDSYSVSLAKAQHTAKEVASLSKAPTCVEAGYTYYECEVCKTTWKDNYVEADGVHEFGHDTNGECVDCVKVDATCTEPGYTVHTCEDCGYTYQTVNEFAAGHDYKAANYTWPTCTSMGYTTYVCSGCGDSYDGTYTAAYEHSFVNYVSNNDATCFANGTKTAYCEFSCGATHTVEAAGSMLTHDWSVVKTVDATCTEQGYVESVCGLCQSVKTEVLDVVAHNWPNNGDFERVDATCVSQGYEIRTCSDCGYAETQNYTIGSHNHVATEVDATCTEGKHIIWTCTYCGDSYVIYDQNVVATGHKYDDANKVTVKEPTCIEYGITVNHCTECGYAKQELIDRLNNNKGEHDFVMTEEVEATFEASGYQVFTCSVCGESYKKVLPATGDTHDYKEIVKVEATCTEQGYSILGCAICGDTYTTYTPALGHGDNQIETKPTCTENGYITHTCGKSYVVDGKTVTCGYTWVTEKGVAAGHKYLKTDGTENVVDSQKANCSQSGYKVLECVTCGHLETIHTEPANGEHTFGSAVTVNPTCLTGGYDKSICEDCGYVKFDNVSNASGHDLTAGWVTVVKPTCESSGVQTLSCKNCDYSESHSVAATGHSFKTETVEATCTEEGYKIYKCDCGYSYTTVVQKAGHGTFKFVELVTPTCTSRGYSVYSCEDCGEVKYDAYTNVVPHDFGHKADGSCGTNCTTVDATCTEVGYTKHQCKNCSHVQVEYVGTVKGHSYAENVLTQATCQNTGLKVRYCSECGDTYQIVLPITGHNFVEDATRGKPETCLETGLKVEICSGCDAVRETEIKSADFDGAHDWSTTPSEVVDATVDKAGYKVFKCKDCDETKTELIPALTCDHDYKAKTTVKATCTEQGYTVYGCDTCGDTYTTYVKATGHNFKHDANGKCTESGKCEVKKATCTEQGYTTHVCVNASCGYTYVDGYVNPAHKYTEKVVKPTCTEGGYTVNTCGLCGHSYKDEFVPAKGHGDLVKIPAKPATTTAPGNVEYWKCPDCGALFLDAAGKKPTTEADVVIPVIVEKPNNCNLQHVEAKSETCTINGNIEHWVCADCGKYYLDKDGTTETTKDKTVILAGHKMNKVDADSGNCYIEGIKEHYICEYCDGVFVRNSDGSYTATKMDQLYTEPHCCDTTAEHCDALLLGMTDVKAYPYWYHNHIDCIIDRGIMNGTSATTFQPDMSSTRAMIVTMLYRMECERRGVEPGNLEHNYNGGLSDITGKEWYAEAAKWAFATGVMKGVTQADGSLIFNGNGTITREMLAAFLYRYVVEIRGIKVVYNLDTRKVEDVKNNDLSTYSDTADVASWAKEAMQWAVGAGVVNGMTESTLAPKTNASRAQIATMFHRVIELIIEPSEKN